MNKRHKRDVDWCYKGQGFFLHGNRPAKGWGKGSICNQPDCRVTWTKIYSLLKTLFNKHLIHSTKMRFFDSGTNRKGKSSDIFRFWFINKQEFKDKILCQTLIPYVTETPI